MDADSENSITSRQKRTRKVSERRKGREKFYEGSLLNRFVPMPLCRESVSLWEGWNVAKWERIQKVILFLWILRFGYLGIVLSIEHHAFRLSAWLMIISFHALKLLTCTQIFSDRKSFALSSLSLSKNFLVFVWFKFLLEFLIFIITVWPILENCCFIKKSNFLLIEWHAILLWAMGKSFSIWYFTLHSFIFSNKHIGLHSITICKFLKVAL